MATNFEQSDIKRVGIEKARPIHQSDIGVKVIKNRHIDGYIINFGLAADRPDGSSYVKSWFATDTNVLSIYNGTSWVSTTLT